VQTSEENIRVMVVDDTAVYRHILSEVIGSIPGVILAGTAPNGRIALDKMKLKPVDLLLLDVEMPVLNGLQTLEIVSKENPNIGVVIVSGINKSAASLTITALEKGAIDFIPKPEGSDMEASRRELTENVRKAIQLFTMRKLRDRGIKPDRPAPRTPREPVRAKAPDSVAISPGKHTVPETIKVVAIGISTGGPEALGKVIPRLPSDLGVPVLIVQHMPPVFTASLAASLAKKSKLRVMEAAEGQSILPNEVLIAPGGKHMVVRQTNSASEGALCIGLNDNPPENNCRPAVDVLFRSVAANYGQNILAVVMTGMGSDGCKGVQVMRRRGAYCIVQDEATSVVYGMPRAVCEAGLSDESHPLDQIAGRIESLVKGKGG
jgi:two-component system chemotaxis response regulator CheB